jgi:hypothetical protein
MTRSLCVAALSAIVGLAACGKPANDQQKQQAQAPSLSTPAPAAKAQQQAAKSSEQAVQDAAQGLEQFAKGLQQAAGAATGDTKPVNPVSFRDLQNFFPDLSGWTKEKPTGERMTAPFAYSVAEVHYSKADASIDAKITDSGFNQLLIAPFAMFLQTGYEKETSDGYEKATLVNAQPGWEKWNSSDKDGELNAVVGKRFLVQLTGNHLADVKDLQAVANKIDMGKLASLK